MQYPNLYKIIPITSTLRNVVIVSFADILSNAQNKLQRRLLKGTPLSLVSLLITETVAKPDVGELLHTIFADASKPSHNSSDMIP